MPDLTIWKFSFDVSNEVNIEMPKGARIICVADQNTVPCIWAIVNPDNPMELRNFFIRGTGSLLGEADPSGYIGTFQQLNAALVWHLFEKKIVPV